MAEENNFLYLKNTKDKISYDKIAGKQNKKDFAANKKLQQIFNFFDLNGDATLEKANTQGLSEIQSLWDCVNKFAKKNGNSIFEENEAQEFLNSTIDETGKSLADYNVTTDDLFGFLASLKNSSQSQAPQTLHEGLTPKEVQTIATKTIDKDVEKAKAIFNTQNNTQGDVSKFVNNTKETFDTEYAASRVNRYIMKEEFCSQLLKQAQENNLSVKAYYQNKISFLITLLPELKDKETKSTLVKQLITFGMYKNFDNKTKAEQERIIQEAQIDFLKKALENLTPEELNQFTSRILSLSDEEYAKSAPELTKNLIKQTLDINAKYKKERTLTLDTTIPGSVKSIISTQEAYRKMTFDETFYNERGVVYTPQNITDYTEKEANLQFLITLNNKNEELKSILYQNTIEVKGNITHGSPSEKNDNTAKQKLAISINRAVEFLYGTNADEAQKVIDEIMGKDSGIKVIKDSQNNFIELDFNGYNPNPLKPQKIIPTENNPNLKITLDETISLTKPIDSFDLVKLSEGLQNKIESKYQNALNGKTLEEYSEETKAAYKNAYGENKSPDMANAYKKSQQEGVQTTKSTIQGLGMVAMIAGQLIPVAGQAATALTLGGLTTSTISGAGISTLEKATQKGGITQEDKEAIFKELALSIGLIGSGAISSKVSSAAFQALILKNCPKLIAFASEVGIDATTSLLADYVITGDIDLKGEGFSQLQSILIGVIRAKGNLPNYINTHIQNGISNNYEIPKTPENNKNLNTYIFDETNFKDLLQNKKIWVPSENKQPSINSVASYFVSKRGGDEKNGFVILVDDAFISEYNSNKKFKTEVDTHLKNNPQTILYDFRSDKKSGSKIGTTPIRAIPNDLKIKADIKTNLINENGKVNEQGQELVNRIVDDKIKVEGTSQLVKDFLKENIIVDTYESEKRLMHNINKQLEAKGIDINAPNTYIYVPRDPRNTPKSCDRVSYTYALEMNMDLSHLVTDISAIPKGANVIILDDFAGSGNSFVQFSGQLANKDINSLTIAPLTSTKGSNALWKNDGTFDIDKLLTDWKNTPDKTKIIDQLQSAEALSLLEMLSNPKISAKKRSAISEIIRQSCIQKRLKPETVDEALSSIRSGCQLNYITAREAPNVFASDFYNKLSPEDQEKLLNGLGFSSIISMLGYGRSGTTYIGPVMATNTNVGIMYTVSNAFGVKSKNIDAGKFNGIKFQASDFDNFVIEKPQTGIFAIEGNVITGNKNYLEYDHKQYDLTNKITTRNYKDSKGNIYYIQQEAGKPAKLYKKDENGKSIEIKELNTNFGNSVTFKDEQNKPQVIKATDTPQTVLDYSSEGHNLMIYIQDSKITIYSPQSEAPTIKLRNQKGDKYIYQID